MERNTITVIMDDGTEAFWALSDEDVDEATEYIRKHFGDPDSIRR